MIVDTAVELDLLERTFRFVLPGNEESGDIPALKSVSVTPAVLDPGRSIGTREVVRVDIADFQFSFDADAYDASTFWLKLRARKHSIQGAPLRVIRNGVASHYVADTWSITATGATITSRDPLFLLNGDTAQVPKPAGGSLSALLSSSALSLTLLPSGIGDVRYPSSGRLCIGGSEVVSYTRAGDVCTLSARGVAGTLAQEHEAGSKVQPCLFFDDEAPSFILASLFQSAGLDPDLWDIEQWEESDSYVAAKFTGTVPDSQPAVKLANEIIEQAALTVLYDPVANKIRLYALAPVVSESIVNVSNIVHGSFSFSEQPDSRVSQLIVNYGMRDATRKVDETNNYKRGVVTFSDNQADYPNPAIKKIDSRWISNPVVARRLSNLITARYKNPPRKFEFTLFRGTDTLALGDGVNVGHWRIVNTLGEEILIPAQVVSVTRSDEQTKYVAEEMGFEFPIDPALGVPYLESARTVVIGADPSFNSCSLIFTPDGLFDVLSWPPPSVVPPISEDEWFEGVVPGVGALYYIKVSQNSGPAPGGLLDEWLHLSTIQVWQISATSEFEIFIATAADDGAVVTSGVVTVTIL